MARSVEGRNSTETVARIDQPHSRIVESKAESREVLVPAGVSAAAGDLTPESREQICQQAGQLAGHLRNRLRDLDQREAHINASVALLENELRTSRLLFAEKESRFSDREAELQKQLTVLQTRIRSASADVVWAEESRRREAGKLAKREASLQERERVLAENQTRIQAATEDLHARGEQFRVEQEEAKSHQERMAQEFRRRKADLDRERADFERHQTEQARQLEARFQRREQLLADSEASLAKQFQQLLLEQTRLAEQFQRIEHERTEERARREEEAQRLVKELAGASHALATRSETLDRREAAMEKLRDEARRAQHETLEMRLVIEQLWSELCEVKDDVEVTRSLGQLRAELSDRYRIARTELEDERKVALELAERLRDQQESLKRRRAETDTWLRHRESDLEKQAGQIVVRQQEIERRERSLEQQRSERQAERWDLLRQIRRLQADLRQVMK